MDRGRQDEVNFTSVDDSTGVDVLDRLHDRTHKIGSITGGGE